MSGSRVNALPGYGTLASVLDDALTEAQTGKGKERHATPEPFCDQLVCQIIRRVGHGYPRGQAMKKIDEAGRLPPKAAEKELLGAINYIAADIVMLREEQSL